METERKDDQSVCPVPSLVTRHLSSVTTRQPFMEPAMVMRLGVAGID
jgi:hypothetical protein